MKRLTLLRHAKSAWGDPALSDIDRPLNARGRRAARAIGQKMRGEQLRFDLVVASPAARVVETLQHLEKGYGKPLRAHIEPRLYLASVGTLLDIARHTDDAVDHLLVVGHNPGLERFALFLAAPTADAFRRRVEEKFPTGALAEIALPVRHWSETREGEGKIERFVRPRDLNPELGAGA